MRINEHAITIEQNPTALDLHGPKDKHDLRMLGVAVASWLVTPLSIDASDPVNRWDAFVVWWEVLTLPAGLLSLTGDADDEVLQITTRTAARSARLLVSVPFAALLLAARARYRLPSFSEAV